MPANILDPRMIDATKPLSCLSVDTPSLVTNNATINNSLFTNAVTANLITINSSLLANTVTTPILSTINLTTNNISTNQGTIAQATITNAAFTGEVTTKVILSTIALSSYTFTDTDNSKIFHFDTNTQPQITATFLSGNITEGFNVSIINTGTGLITLSSDFTPIINATNPFNSVRYSGMYIYRSNNQLFGVGVFE
jgi:hypothetical protein